MSRSLYLCIRRVECSNYRGISLLSKLCKIVSSILLSRLPQYTEELGIISVDFDAICQLLIIRVYSAFVRYLNKNRNTM